MNTTEKNKKLKVMELQNGYSAIPQTAYSEEIEEKLIPESKKKDIKAVNRFHIILALMYITVFILATMVKMLVVYDITNLGLKKIEKENRLNELKVEVDALENIYISNYDLKKVQEKSKEMGFVANDNMRFINLNK